jgi:hypothetical protein
MITYRYALDVYGDIVSIDHVFKYSKYHSFTCIECGKRLVPRAIKSQKVSLHFYHFYDDPCKKEIVKCSGEGYLHKMAKKLLFESLKLHKPFYLGWRDTISCINREADRMACYKDITRTIDLLRGKHFVFLEKRDGDFIPDILLVDENREKIYIEIYSKNKCSQKKLDSSNRIIEIKINRESDIEHIVKNREIHCDSPQISLSNFNLEKYSETFDCKGQCIICLPNIELPQESIGETEYQSIIEDNQKEWTPDSSDQAIIFLENFFNIGRNDKNSAIFDILEKMYVFYQRGYAIYIKRQNIIKRPKHQFHILKRENGEFVFGVYKEECYATVYLEKKLFLYKIIGDKLYILSQIKSIETVSEYIDSIEDLF